MKGSLACTALISCRYPLGITLKCIHSASLYSPLHCPRVPRRPNRLSLSIPASSSIRAFSKKMECGDKAGGGKRKTADMTDGASCAKQVSSDCAKDCPSSLHAKSLKDFGYHFDSDGVMRDENGEGYVFVDQKSYEAIGEAVTEEVYRILETPPYSLCRTHFGEGADDSERSFVFHSKDFDKKKHLVVLIHGRGVVRAGQWARRLIMNESLDRGTQLPYIRECARRGWGMLLMNTNHNSFIDAQGNRKAFKGSGSAHEHGVTVWRHFIDPSQAQSIAVVAHSAGGMVISNILEECVCWRAAVEGRCRVGCVCLADAFFDAPSLAPMPDETRPRVRHWVAHPSHRIGAPVPSAKEDRCVERVSAGTNVHEETSPVAIDDIFQFIQNTFDSIEARK